MASVLDTPEFSWSLLVAHWNCLTVTTTSVHWNSLWAHSHCCGTLELNPPFCRPFLTFTPLHLVIPIFYLLLPPLPTAWPLIIAIAIFGFMSSFYLLLASAIARFSIFWLIIGHIISCFHHHISSSIFLSWWPFLIQIDTHWYSCSLSVTTFSLSLKIHLSEPFRHGPSDGW
jgi:hypothetical protein